MKIDKVFVFGSAKDIPILHFSLPAILNYISASSYFLVCDELDVKRFQIFKNLNFSIVSDQSVLGENFRYLNIRNKKLYSWYKQQVVKLLLCNQQKPNDIILLWDGDTVPLKRLDFFKNNRLNIRLSHEYHPMYFISILQILNLRKITPKSFISQCFLLKASWSQLMCQAIEKNMGENFVTVVSNLANSSKLQCFSEYESLGTYIHKYFFYEINLIERDWLRFGSSIFKSPDKLNNFNIGTQFEYVSFESWDKASIKAIFVRFFYFIYYYKRLAVAK